MEKQIIEQIRQRIHSRYKVDQLKHAFCRRTNDEFFFKIGAEVRPEMAKYDDMRTATIWLGYEVATNSQHLQI